MERPLQQASEDGLEATRSPTPRLEASITLRPYLLEAAFLLTQIAIVAVFVAPSHWTSIWMDREFTGWVAPIANRLHDGVKLYQDGMHLPMPPLPFVLVEMTAHGHATWITESVYNCLFQGLALALMYVCLTTHFPRPVPFLAVSAAIPIFYSLPKTILYDSIPQFLVAAAACRLAFGLRGDNKKHAETSHWRPWLHGALLGTLTAGCILSKQTTGIGLMVGCAFVLILSGGGSLAERLKSLAIYLAATMTAAGLLCAVVSPFVNVAGLVQDVFLTGSEPKGGLAKLLPKFLAFGMQVGAMVAKLAVAFVILKGMLRERPTPLVSKESIETNEISEMVCPNGWSSNACYSLALAAPIVLILLESFSTKEMDLTSRFERGAVFALHLGLAATLIVAVVTLLGRPAGRMWQSPGLALLFLVLFPSALFHSLSVDSFRWIYDNNPLIVLTLATLFLLLFQALGSEQASWFSLQRASLFGAMGLLLFCCWGTFIPQYRACRKCRDRWDEIDYLAGARLSRHAGGMRDIVHEVRSLTPDVEHDEVLLLPNDPNVESWIGRKRPVLNGAIIFGDQYWDRYVEADFERLRISPPRVIVVGPRNFWRTFHRYCNINRGAERLIDLVRDQLIPEQYELRSSRKIRFQKKSDYMDVYVRKSM